MKSYFFFLKAIKESNHDKFGDENDFTLFEENDNDKNKDDDDLLVKFGKFENKDSSDDENSKKSLKNKSENKIFIKKNLKRIEKTNTDLVPQSPMEFIDSTRDSLSINDKLRVNFDLKTQDRTRSLI